MMSCRGGVEAVHAHWIATTGSSAHVASESAEDGPLMSRVVELDA